MNDESLRYSMDWDNVTASKADIVSDWNYHKLIHFLTLDNRGEVEEGKHCVGTYGVLRYS